MLAVSRETRRHSRNNGNDGKAASCHFAMYAGAAALMSENGESARRCGASLQA